MPDGDPTPSFEVTHRAVYTLLPKNGQISFALIPGPYGAIALRDGYCDLSLSRQAVADVNETPLTRKWNVEGTNNWPMLPYPVLPTSFGAKSFGGYSATAWRLITCVADVNFTGAAMMNQGSMLTSTASLTPSLPNGAYTLPQGFQRVREISSIDVNTIRPDSVSQPARLGCTMRVLPSDYDYQPMWTDSITATSGGTPICNPIAVNAADTALVMMSNPGFNPGTIRTYTAAGLDSSASITVTIRTCIQYQIDQSNSAMVPFLGPSPPVDQSAIAQVRNISRNIPSSTVLEYGKTAWKIGKALATSYMSSSPAPLLQLMDGH